MKVKSVPEDFVVNEISHIEPRASGRYGLYVLEKKGWNTSDLLKGIASRAGLPYRLFAYGGRKDRHAHTFQHVTVEAGVDLTTSSGGYRFERIGFVDRAMGPDMIEGNEFSITLRSLSGDDVEAIRRNATEVAEEGFPNYFDDQRFGGMDPERGFMAERILKGQWRGSLEIYLTSCRPEDPREIRDRKREMRECWGDWRAMLRVATDGGAPIEIAMLQLLAEERGAYVKALRMIPREELSLFFSAYQSFLWNEMARRLISEVGDEPLTYHGVAGPYVFYRRISVGDLGYLRDLIIPLPAAARIEDERISGLLAAVLEERGLHQGRFNVRRLRQAFFKPTPRRVIVFPEHLTVSDAAKDEMNPGRKRAIVSFFLPRGSYGTMLVKRLSVR